MYFDAKRTTLVSNLREPRSGEKTRLVVDIDDTLWLHADDAQSRLNTALLKIISLQYALGRKIVLMTNRSEVSVFEEAIKSSLVGLPMDCRATTLFITELTKIVLVQISVCFFCVCVCVNRRCAAIWEHLSIIF